MAHGVCAVPCFAQVVGVIESLARGSGGEPELREAMEILKVRDDSKHAYASACLSACHDQACMQDT